MTDGDAVVADTGRESIGHEPATLPRELRHRNPILFWTALLHLLLFGVFIAGVLADPRTVGGEPAWLKPAKFAGSLALLAGTIGWLTPHVGRTGRDVRFVSWAIVVTAIVEITAIGGQAARGVGSHFNSSTRLDLAIYLTMGAVIIVLTLLIAWVFVRTARSGDDVHPAFGLGIVLGGSLFVLGALEGTVMIAAGANGVPPPAGGVWPSVTVPVVGWSLVGDFRLAHFVGLHALQVLPLAGYLSAVGARRGRIENPRRIVWFVGVAYAACLVAAFVLATAPLMWPGP